ncbi:MAG: VWA domain-containing protein [Lysobacterales bacterium]|nr:MAG: VWA domain-containing protein [Xanthomonadales bacterium]
MPSLLENLLVFGRVLRREGIDVHPGRMLDVVEALRHVSLGARDEVYHACRALLVHLPEQIGTFDRVFAAFWRVHGAPEDRTDMPSDEPRASVDEVDEIEVILALDEPAAAGDSTADLLTPEAAVKIWSDRGGLADKDFAAFTVEEIAEARKALGRLAWNPGVRRTRRWVRGRGTRVDLRRAIAESLRSGGDVVTLPTRKRRVRPRRLVLLCDVSGSMERYSRMLLHFAHALTARHQRVEAFLFSTQLTRITKQLNARRPDDALAAVSRSVPDWSGGTRIGGAIKEFHQRWGRRVLNGGPVVLLISDGWDRGDPEVLRAQIARLQRRCYRLVWLNPLIGTTGYSPLTRGLQAALPYVDDFLPSRTLGNLADLAAHLNTLSTRPT